MTFRRAGYTGLDSGLSTREFGIVPSTADIGRSFLWPRSSLLVLTDPHYSCARDSLEDSLVLRLYRHYGEIRILNAGCGGCSDVPFLEQRIKQSLPFGARVRITNLDISQQALSAVRAGFHPHFSGNSSVSLKGDIVAQIEQYKRECFEKDEQRERLARPSVVVDSAYSPGFTPELLFMNDKLRSSLELCRGDIRRLPFRDGSFQIVFSHHVLLYLSEKGRLSARDELVRVICDEGFVFPEFAVYQKVDGFTRRVTNRLSFDAVPLNGILPTNQHDGKRVRFQMEERYRSRDLRGSFLGYTYRNYDGLFHNSPDCEIYDLK